MNKTIDLLWKMLTAPAGTQCRAYATELQEAYNREKLNRWHDLRKDPDDLPEEHAEVLVLHEYWHYKAEKMDTEYETGYYARGVWGGAAGQGKDNKVIAWRHICIEPFEVES